MFKTICMIIVGVLALIIVIVDSKVQKQNKQLKEEIKQLKEDYLNEIHLNK